MIDRRHKDGNWKLPTNNNGNIERWEHVQIAVLMDIRDELKRLNAVLHCHNFLDVPFKLDAIKKNTTKPERRKRKTV